MINYYIIIPPGNFISVNFIFSKVLNEVQNKKIKICGVFFKFLRFWKTNCKKWKENNRSGIVKTVTKKPTKQKSLTDYLKWNYLVRIQESSPRSDAILSSNEPGTGWTLDWCTKEFIKVSYRLFSTQTKYGIYSPVFWHMICLRRPKYIRQRHRLWNVSACATVAIFFATKMVCTNLLTPVCSPRQIFDKFPKWKDVLHAKSCTSFWSLSQTSSSKFYQTFFQTLVFVKKKIETW